MCTGARAAKKAAQAQAEATEKLAAAQKAKTTEMVSQTQGVIETNPKAKAKKPMYSLRIPMNATGLSNLGSGLNTYGLNIPL